MRKVYASTFERLRDLGAQVRAAAAEVQTMLAAMFRELNAEFGFSLQPPGDLQLHDFERELAQIEESYLQYLSFGNTLKLANPMFGQRMLKALGMRLRAVFESAANDLDLWSKSATSQLDAQLKERKRSFARRMEAVDRIHEAASGLAQRIAEIESAEQQLVQLSSAWCSGRSSCCRYRRRRHWSQSLCPRRSECCCADSLNLPLSPSFL